MEVVADQTDKTYSETMRERLNTMKRGCRKHGLDRPGIDRLHKLNPWEYLINWEHKLVWCNVFKSGSTSWMYLFNRMAGYSDKKLAQEKRLKRVPMLQLARDKYGRPSQQVCYPSLLIIRGHYRKKLYLIEMILRNNLVGSYSSSNS